MSKPKLINIGCGPKFFEVSSFFDIFELIRLNNNMGASPDVLCEPEALPYEDESIEAILVSHALDSTATQLNPWVLDEWYRVLKPGGQMFIVVPNYWEFTKKSFIDYISSLGWDKGCIIEEPSLSIYHERELRFYGNKIGKPDWPVVDFSETISDPNPIYIGSEIHG